MSQSLPAPRVSVIIPSLDGLRGGSVPRLLETVRGQTFKDHEVHLVKGVSPQGRAINQGVACARGDILIILDDDTELADEAVFEKLAATLDANPRIAMAGASIVAAPHADAFQRRAARQFPRFNMPVVDAVTDSDYPCHGCCAVRTAVFNEIGREREDLLRGLDPDLRARIRAAGYRVVLVPDARVYHPLPNGMRALLRVFFRNGYGSAYAQKFHPDTVYETRETLDIAGFRPRRPLVYRALRFPVRLVKALVQGKTLRFAGYTAYAFGYAWGLLTARETAVHGPED